MLLPALVAWGLSLAVVGTAVPMALPAGGPGGPPAAQALPAAGVAEPHASLPQVSAPHPHAVRRARGDEPLAVTLDALSPSFVPAKGVLRITGSVTNTDHETWSAINVLPILSSAPMTSTAELAEAAALGPTSYIGDRIVEPGSFDTIPSLDPGESAQFAIRLPQSQITVSAAGVYWLGIHALGEGPELRDGSADGRARTFIPLVPRTKASVDTALVIPLRRQVDHAADGRVENLAGWTRTLANGGRLRSLLEFGASAGSRPISWLLDPALPDTIRALAAGNPPRSLTPTEPDPAGPAGSSSGPKASASGPSGAPSTEPDPETDPADAAAESAATAAAGPWLDRLKSALGSGQILALPYGNVDVPAAAEHDPESYVDARELSGTVLQPWGLRMSSAVASPSGYLDGAAIELVESGATVLVTDRMFPDGAPVVARTSGKRLVTTSAGAASGGPGPDARLGGVTLRQRILSEAALHLLEPGRRPLVVVFPQSWTPTGTTDFFEGLDVDWMHLTTVAGVASRAVEDVASDRLSYPNRESRRELTASNFASAAALAAAGETLQNVLADNDSIAAEVTKQSLNGISYAGRLHPDATRASLDRSRAWIEGQLGAVGVEAPPGVTLSSANGRFAATLTNKLDQPVEVGLQALTDDALEISGPTSVAIGAGDRTTVLLNASTDTVGVHQVTLVVTDLSGTPLGASDDMTIRSAQVSQVIWVILGGGAALLFGAIAVRLFRRVRAARVTAAR